MFIWNTIKFTHVSLCLTPKILYPINIILLVREQFTVVNTVMFKF